MAVELPQETTDRMIDEILGDDASGAVRLSSLQVCSMISPAYGIIAAESTSPKQFSSHFRKLMRKRSTGGR